MTRPERYEELRQKGQLPVNCTDLDKTVKLIGSLSKKGDVYFPCDRCRRDHRLTWEKVLEVHEQWERDNGQVSEVTALKEIVREVSELVVSDGMSELVALQVRARELLKKKGVKDINENRE